MFEHRPFLLINSFEHSGKVPPIYVLAEHIDHLLADPVASTTLSKINSVRQRKEWIVSHLSTLQKK